ncbi:deubiquitinating protein VCIP135-like [Scleropages formosus]|uniref:Deubiquitinating protein VCPIP1 n=1 Tax=Scleropages formosus TaxID=113540 RepID=A0A0N8K1C4_SCLFO|nr:deubiquitinating protein VCIP135 [Scleropages formosus]KPP74545.1 deubiquitinating protein VCIP135-like [Scleropages formosus]
MSLQQGSKKKDKRILCGTCPDPKCQARLFFPAHGSVSIECTECGQRHEQRNLLKVEEVTDPDVVLHNLLRNALLGVTGAPKKGTELVKVMGLSNYHCKLLSPILTKYGMDKQTGKAKLLRDMNQGDMFDCSLLGDRAFLIEEEHVCTVGYGKDRSGSLIYLHDTLEEVKKANRNKECLIPVHVDGDGHCLVHAVSRALVGRELFWHALRENLKQNFKENLDRYKALFQDFIDAAEWEDIINECDPLFVPPEGVPLGLRNIHIFGLANVLHRPIILLDSLSGMRSSGDYSATFLPGLVPEEKCRGKDGQLNKPICIAWSSSGRNHYIPLVGIKNAPLPRLPARLLPKAWGVPQELIKKYIALELDGSCIIGGDRSLQDKYLMRLVAAMEEVFMEKYSIHPSLVADVHQYVYRRTGVIGVQPEEVTEAAKKSVLENRLHRCLICNALSELHVPPEWLSPGGKFYNLAKSTHGQLKVDKNYSFPLNNVVCSYDPERDVLVPDYKLSTLSTCNWCHGTSVRHIRGDGSVVYLDGDRTNTRSQGGKCGCGFKHFWEGKEYDNLPEAFPITLEWGGRVVRETVYWFQFESDPSLNSNVYDVAMKLVTKHFPGEFGSEILVQKVVNTILHHTAKKNPDEYNPVAIDGAHAQRVTDSADGPGAAETQPPTKIILTGQKAKTLHKEELTMSKAERSIQQSIGEHAPVAQKKRTERLKQEQRGQVRPASPGMPQDGPSSSSAPATPTKAAATASPKSNKEKKIRVTTDDGRQAMLTLQAETTFSELQGSIAKEFSVPPAQQCIRYGFPPKELLPPKEGQEKEPLPLQHGDRVTVETLRDPREKGGPAPAAASASTVALHSAGSEEPASSSRVTSRELQENIDLEMSSLCLLATLMGEDVWSYAKKLPHLFQQGGVFYNIMKKDMGLMDGKHCTLPHLSGKTFVYNAAEERLELCVDAAGHFPVGPDVEELVKEALAQLRSEAAARSREGSPAHGPLRLGSGGVVRKKEALRGVTAFQGKGHSLGGSPPERKPLTRKHSAGVDLSASASVRPTASEDAARELVRTAPGFVTLRDGRHLDPSTVEAQRRRLQEMVSSIQASMDRHLREQSQGTGDPDQHGTETGAPADRTEVEPPSAPEPSSMEVSAAGGMAETALMEQPEKGVAVEEQEEMESQDAEPTNTMEPMDHS